MTPGPEHIYLFSNRPAAIKIDPRLHLALRRAGAKKLALLGWNQFDLPTGGHDLTSRHIESNAKQAMTFQPGQSGNPGGRRRKSDDDRQVEELARAYGVEAIKTLASIMRSEKAPASARSAAAQAVLDRGFGRPQQSIRHGGEEDGPPIRIETMSDYELEKLLERLRRS